MTLPGDIEFQSLPQIRVLGTNIKDVVTATGANATIFIFSEFDASVLAAGTANPILAQLTSLAKYDSSFSKTTNFFVTDAGHRVVTASVGKLERDYDDVRRYVDAVARGIKRLKQTGKTAKLRIVLQEPKSKFADDLKQFIAASILSALFETHEQLQARETLEKDKLNDGIIEDIEFAVIGSGAGIEAFMVDQSSLSDVTKFVLAVEEGRRLARDIGGPDPERMTALKCAGAIEAFLKKHSLDKVVKFHAQSDLKVIAKEYPLLDAVARASLHIDRHHPCVVTLEYRSPDQSKVEEELFMVGKGVTYDTGGADIKTNGIMAGMSRDKCGAAAIAGFVATVGRLQPVHLNVKAKLAFVRNTCGADSYVTDEIIRARSGIRVRVGNTDAEGRFAMADLLCELREEAEKKPEKARLFTCATLTGHAARAVGNYPIAMDNGPARSLGIANSLQQSGTFLGEPFEVSQIRRDDFNCIEAVASNRYDINQISKEKGPRGHQYPAAFLAISSGLDKCGRDSATPLAYTHLDIAGSAEESDGDKRVTASPMLGLTGRFLAGLGTKALRYLIA